MKYLRPFFCYYGGKWRAAPKYQQPIHDTLIEPFAGSAGYSCRNYTKKVILYDLDPVIAGVWDYLINTTSEEILSLPTTITHIDNMNLTQEQRWLIGFWLNKAGTSPGKSPSMWMRDYPCPGAWWGEIIRKRIADQLPYIKHWKIYNQSYDTAPDIEATWFIDPPYDNSAGAKYNFKFKAYPELAEFCKSRKGQAIVCEQEGATWLPFQFFSEIKSAEGKRGKSKSREAVWYNQNSHLTISNSCIE